LALTTTATPKVKEDIINELKKNRSFWKNHLQGKI
jgi:superfamily II DNA helicase RecQ